MIEIAENIFFINIENASSAKLSSNKINEINKFGEKCIELNNNVLKYFDKSELNKLEYLLSFVKMSLSKARILSKLMTKEKGEAVSNLTDSLKLHKEAYEMMQNWKGGSSDELQELKEISKNMIEMLPAKIAKVNNDENNW